MPPMHRRRSRRPACRAAALLNRFGMGLGGMALANLVNPARLFAASVRGRPGRGILGGQLHYPAKAKRVIYLFMAGGPSQIETFDYKPVLNAAQRRAAAGFRAARAAAHRDVRQSVVAAAGGLAVRVRPARQQRHVGVAICCRTRPGSSTSCASSARCSPTRSTTTRRSRSSRQARRSPAGPAWDRGFTTGSAATTRISRRSSSSSRRARWISRCTRGSGAAGFFRPQHQGVQFRSGKDAVLYLGNPDWCDAREPAAAAGSVDRNCTRTPPSGSATPRWTRASRSTRCRTGCRRACPA